MGNNLHEASMQWATRPDDERFWNLEEMALAAKGFRVAAEEKTYSPGEMRVVALSDTGLAIRRKDDKGGNGFFSHYSLRQLNTLVNGPIRNSAFAEVDADFAARGLNIGLNKYKGEETKVLWNKRNGMARAFTSTGYGRIWNEEIVRNLIPLQQKGWQVPPARPTGSNDKLARPATQADLLASRNRSGGGAGIQLGDPIAPAGLYLSEKDMFAFMVNESCPIDGGAGKPLYRGFFIGNSEVGDMSFWVKSFLYNMVCGNHIVWDASKVETIRIVHRGEKAPARAFEHLAKELKRYTELSASHTESRIKAAKVHLLGQNQDGVVEFINQNIGASQAIAMDALKMAEWHPEDGGNCNPLSAWGVAQGMTRLSQGCRYTDERVKLDKYAGEILDSVPF